MNRQIFAFLIAFLCCIAAVTAFRCYTCSGPSCVNPTADQAKDCGAESVCFKTYIGAGTSAGATRGCGKSTQGGDKVGPNDCLDMTLESVTTSVCNCNSKELCNSAGSSKISYLTAAASLVVIGVFSLLM